MREFKVICEDTGHRYGVIAFDETKAWTLLTGPEVERVIQHLLYPHVGKHSVNKDEFCRACNSAREIPSSAMAES